MLIIIISTVIVLAKRSVEDIDKTKKNVLKYWGFWGAVKIVTQIISYVFSLWHQSYVADNGSAVGFSYSFISIQTAVLEILSLLLFVEASVNTVRLIKLLKATKE